MTLPFADSPNTLFQTRVDRLAWLSENFVRVTVTGPNLHRVTPGGLDQRVKILIPIDGNSPSAFEEDLMREWQWRQRWRSLEPTRRPALRSYTTSHVRPEMNEVDIDFYIHTPAGPASAWAHTCRPGDRLLLSAPDREYQIPGYGIQWRPAGATQVLLLGDESAYPAIRGIAAAFAPRIRARIMLEATRPEDAAWLVHELNGHTVTVHQRADDGTGALADPMEDWCRANEELLASEDFYAWIAMESVQLSRLRERIFSVGVAPRRVHAQGYWNAAGRPR